MCSPNNSSFIMHFFRPCATFDGSETGERKYVFIYRYMAKITRNACWKMNTRTMMKNGQSSVRRIFEGGRGP